MMAESRKPDLNKSGNEYLLSDGRRDWHDPFFLRFPMSDDADRFRKEADKCFRLASKTVNPRDKSALRWMAAEWLKLAEAAERLSKLH